MEMEAGLILELWDVVSNKIPAKERGDIAYMFLKTFQDWEVNITGMRDLREEDRYIDDAITTLEDETDEDEEDAYYEE